MDFAAAARANDFLLAEILTQAAADGDVYSEAELELLRWPRSELTIEEEEALGDESVDSIPADFDFLRFHRKAAGHLRRAYAAARNADPSAAARFESAYAALRGALVPLAGFTHRDAPVLATVVALRLGGAFQLMSMVVDVTLNRATVIPMYPTRVLAVFAVIALAAGVVLRLLFLWR